MLSVRTQRTGCKQMPTDGCCGFTPTRCRYADMWGTNQLIAPSETEALENCLRQGARVIEIDVYDDKTTGKPVVGHGGPV